MCEVLLMFQMGRSSNMPQIQPIIERLMEEARPYNRVYVASIHSDLNENDLQRYSKRALMSWLGFFISMPLSRKLY